MQLVNQRSGLKLVAEIDGREYHQADKPPTHAGTVSSNSPDSGTQWQWEKVTSPVT